MALPDKDINVHEAILEVSNMIEKVPLMVHSEADLSALLYNELSKQDRNPIETNNFIQKDKTKLKTTRVHCEYHRIDIVVFGKEYISDIKYKNTLLYDSAKSGEIFCDSIIQLKHENGEKDNKKEVKNDFKKLRENYKHFLNKYSKRSSMYFFFLCVLQS